MKSKSRQAYQGFHPQPTTRICRINDIESITPESFYHQFIKTRTPCLISLKHAKNVSRDHPLFDFLGLQKWNQLEYLKEKAGDAVVQVERKGKEGTFGSGNQRFTMTLSEFIHKLEQGEQDLYLTTQYAEWKKNHASNDNNTREEEEKWQEYCQAPCSSLLHDIVLRPRLLGNLIPQQVNVWMGSTKTPTSSGLHHDFADNVYVLLKGKKQFTLFSPRDAPYLYTVGQIDKVYPNGFIAYKPPQDIDSDDEAPLFENEDMRPRADGAYPADVAQYHLQVAQAQLELAEEQGNQIEIQQAEKRVQDAMEAVLDMGLEVDDFAREQDDFEWSDGEDAGDSSSKDIPSFSSSSRPKSDPPSFCKVPVDVLKMLDGPRKEKAYQRYPLLRKATRMVCHMEQGDILYLPAGWFHEVTSMGSSPDSPIHMAFNYWHHPPSRQDFEHPYEDGYWAHEYNKIEQSLVSRQTPSLSNSCQDACCGIKKSLKRKRVIGDAAWIVTDRV